MTRWLPSCSHWCLNWWRSVWSVTVITVRTTSWTRTSAVMSSSCSTPDTPSSLSVWLCGRIQFAESGFRFIVNLDLDSLTDRMVWIRGCCRKWRHCFSFTFVILMSLPVSLASPHSKMDSLDSWIRIWICTLNGWIRWIWKIGIQIRIRQIEYGLCLSLYLVAWLHENK